MAKARHLPFLTDQNGAVAASYALALFGLVVIGGVGFDYGRLMAMDSELQNGADQAALAGATQLDGKSGACSRAATAAVNLVTNKTLLANDNQAITVASETTCDATGSVRFWQDRAKTNAATSDANARFISLEVDVRSVNYAFTPLTGLLVGSMRAGAMAGLGSSVCKVPPVFMCNPAETPTNLGADFDTTALVGHGVKLLSGSATVPGNFGFLDSNGGNATGDLAKMLGWDATPFDCVATDQVGLNPGQKEVVFNAFNTRFDIDTNGANTCPGSGVCSAALNTRKDLVRNNQCGINGGGWKETDNPYRPTSKTTGITSGYPEIMGHPRDMCHAISYDGDCDYTVGGTTTNQSPIGDGNWDRDAYFQVNYGLNHAGWTALTGLGDTPTRFAVYQWEKANPSYLAAQSVSSPNNHNAHSTPVCNPPQAASAPDRRRFVMAVVNCLSQATKIAGNDKVEILKWVDVFLVEPAFDRGTGTGKRTTGDQVYVEVIGGSTLGGGGSIAAQTIRRDVPYLVH